ncbi:hypothetical protein L6R49_19210 [Myxococcota bacterium]|nr:hypothetical protein [Myxococcota bacterium]
MFVVTSGATRGDLDAGWAAGDVVRRGEVAEPFAEDGAPDLPHVGHGVEHELSWAARGVVKRTEAVAAGAPGAERGAGGVGQDVGLSVA